MCEKVNFGVFKCLGFFFFQFKVGFVTKAGFMCCFVTNETFGDKMSYIFVSSTAASSNMWFTSTWDINTKPNILFNYNDFILNSPYT